MQHWNGHQVCAIDTETTGLDPNWHEMWQICILPLDSDFMPRRDVSPFYINFTLECPERVDWTSDVMKGNKSRIIEATRTGHDKFKAAELFEKWYEKLKLPLNKGGVVQCKVIPLGQNYAFDLGFMKAWLGPLNYDHFFHYHYRDTMPSALFLNDHAAMQAEKVPYPKVGLKWLSTTHSVQLERAHDSLQDCLAVAEVYRKMCQSSHLG